MTSRQKKRLVKNAKVSNMNGNGNGHKPQAEPSIPESISLPRREVEVMIRKSRMLDLLLERDQVKKQAEERIQQLSEEIGQLDAELAALLGKSQPQPVPAPAPMPAPVPDSAPMPVGPTGPVGPQDPSPAEIAEKEALKEAAETQVQPTAEKEIAV